MALIRGLLLSEFLGQRFLSLKDSWKRVFSLMFLGQRILSLGTGKYRKILAVIWAFIPGFPSYRGCFSLGFLGLESLLSDYPSAEILLSESPLAESFISDSPLAEILFSGFFSTEIFFFGPFLSEIFILQGPTVQTSQSRQGS